MRQVIIESEGKVLSVSINKVNRIMHFRGGERKGWGRKRKGEGSTYMYSNQISVPTFDGEVVNMLGWLFQLGVRLAYHPLQMAESVIKFTTVGEVSPIFDVLNAYYHILRTYQLKFLLISKMSWTTDNPRDYVRQPWLAQLLRLVPVSWTTHWTILEIRCSPSTFKMRCKTLLFAQRSTNT